MVRVAVLLPFSSSNDFLREQAEDMLDAAELAVFTAHDDRVVLIPKDTGGTEAGGQQAATSALKDGAQVIVGPLLSRAVTGAAGPARAANVPVLAFSNDRNVAGDGVWLLGFQPEPEVDRIVDYAFRQGHTTFAILRGQTTYGRRVEDEYYKAVAALGGEVTDAQTYSRDTADMKSAAASLAHETDRQKAIAEWEEAGGTGDPALDPEFQFELPYTAVMIPEQGVRLQSLAPLLPYYDVDPRQTQFLGTGLWFDDSLTREPALTNGWFPGPDKASVDQFKASYQSAYDREPGRLASITYDAVRLAGAIAETKGDHTLIRRDWLTDKRGFKGANGLFRLNEDGLAEYALAIYQMKLGHFEVLEPAPEQFEPETN